MADDQGWTDVPTSQQTAPADTSSSGGWQDLPKPSAEEEHQARVAMYQPAANAAVAKESFMPSLLTPTSSSTPIAGPLIEKALAAQQAKSDDFANYGATEDERYKNIIAEHEAYNNARWQQHPVAYGAGHVATNVASAIPLALAAPEAGATLAGAAGLGALTGAASSAASSAPGSTLSDIGKNALTGAEMGAVAGPAGNLVARGAGAMAGAARNTFENLFDTQSSAARALLGNQSALAPGAEAQSIVQKGLAGTPDVMPIDISGAKSTVEKAAGKATDTGAVDQLVTNLNDRYADSSHNFQTAIDSAAGAPINSEKANLDAQQAKTDALKPLYDAAYNAPSAQNLTPDNYQQIVNTPHGIEAMKFANMQMRSKYGPQFPLNKNVPFAKDDEGDFYKTAPLSLEYWDQFKRGLDDQVGKAYNSNEKNLGNLINNDTKSLRNYLRDAVVDENNNSLYGKALDESSRYAKSNNAFEAGQNFFNQANIATKTADPQLPERMLYNFNKVYTDPEKQSMATGLLSYIKENPQQAIRVFNAGDNVTLGRYRQILGDDTFNAVKNATDTAHLAAVSNTITPRLPGNTINQVGLGAMGLALIENPALLANPKALAIAGMGYAAKKGVDAVAARKANAIVRMATSKDPSDWQALQRVLQSDAQSREIMQKLKVGMTGALAANAGVATAHASGGRVGRATGGKVIDAQTLVRNAERAKKRINEGTEPLLTVPDETITKALAIANEKI